MYSADFAERVSLVEKEANLIYIFPSSPLQPLLHSATLSEEEIVYAHAVWKFAVQFINRLGNECVISSLDI